MVLKDASNLKVGKLTTVSTQKNANYKLPLQTSVEHGFVGKLLRIGQTKKKAEEDQNGNCGR